MFHNEEKQTITNYSQDRIITKLNIFLNAINERTKCLPHIYPLQTMRLELSTLGQCHGLTLLWLQRMAEKRDKEFWDTVNVILKIPNDSTQAKYVDEHEMQIEKFIAQMIWAQKSFRYTAHTMHIFEALQRCLLKNFPQAKVYRAISVIEHEIGNILTTYTTVAEIERELKTSLAMFGIYGYDNSITLAIQKTLSDIALLKAKGESRKVIHQRDIDQIMEAKQNKIIGSFSVHSLETILQRQLQEESGASLSGNHHTIGIFKRENQFHYWDCNEDKGARCSSDLSQISKWICKGLGNELYQFHNLEISFIQHPELLSKNISAPLGASVQTTSETKQEPIKVVIKPVISAIQKTTPEIKQEPKILKPVTAKPKQLPQKNSLFAPKNFISPSEHLWRASLRR